MEMKDVIVKYASMMNALPYSAGKCPQILVRIGDRCLATDEDADFSSLTEEDIIDITNQPSVEKDVLMASREARAMILSRTPYVGICVASRRRIPAVLDDMAQIIGQEARVVPRTFRGISRALKSAEAALVRPEESGGYAITCGRNLYEAYVAMTVLEKSAEVILKAAVIGGAKPIGSLDCRLMHQIYRRKYSKAEKEHKDDTEG
ncbi:hypothetical protein [Hornefia butyriciproducens]|uniref:hypothetical protein n=1 Tax=Hornefia butyriciproducens TaxID=2652293 RepID=UPI003F8C5C16